MKVEEKTNHTALAALSRSMAEQSGSDAFRQIFAAMAEEEDALDAMEQAALRLREATPMDNEALVTHKKFLPDGSVEIITTKDGKVVERHKKKPHLVAVPDFTKPPNADGTPQMKMEPHQSVMELLMLGM